MIVYR